MLTLLTLVAVLVCLYAVGRFEAQVSGTTRSMFLLPITLMRQLAAATRIARRTVAGLTRSCFLRAAPLAPQDAERGVWRGWPWVGALLFLGVTLFFLYVDFWLMLLTFSAQGLSAGGSLAAPVGADELAALAIVVVAAFWGAVFLDAIGFTHLGPWGSQDVRGRRAVKSLSLAMIAASALIAGAAGLWRTLQLDQSSVPVSNATAAPVSVIEYADPSMAPSIAPQTVDLPQPLIPSAAQPLVDPRIERWLPVFVGVGLPVLVTLSAAVSGWGATTSAGLLVGLGGLTLSILLALAQLAMTLVGRGLDCVYVVVAHLIRLTALLVRNVWNWLATIDPLGGRPLRAMPHEPNESLDQLAEKGMAAVEAISAEYRRQVYEQFFQEKEQSDGKGTKGPGQAAPVGPTADPHAEHTNGGGNGAA